MRRADLQDGMVPLCHLRRDYDDRMIGTSSLGVRME